jgi:hypothetical protein
MNPGLQAVGYRRKSLHRDLKNGFGHLYAVVQLFKRHFFVAFRAPTGFLSAPVALAFFIKGNLKISSFIFRHIINYPKFLNFNKLEKIPQKLF